MMINFFSFFKKLNHLYATETNLRLWKLSMLTQEAYRLPCSKSFAGGTYLGEGVFTLARGEGVPTLARTVPTWLGRNIAWPGSIFLGQEGYLPWLGGGVPTLALGYLLWPGGYIPWPGGTCTTDRCL